MPAYRSNGIRIWSTVLGLGCVLYLLVSARHGVNAARLLLVLYGVAATAGLAWWFGSFSARVRRGWPALSRGIGLWQQGPVTRLDEEFSYSWPRIVRIRRRGPAREIRIRLLPGQIPADVAANVEAIAHAWRVFRANASSPERGSVVLRVWRHDPPAEAFDARSSPGGGSSPTKATRTCGCRNSPW